MSDIQPGDLVVCVDDAHHPEWGRLCRADWKLLRRLKRGRLYTVAEARLSWAGYPVLALAELPEPAGGVGFCISRFRKIDKSDEGFAAWMRSLKPVPAKQKDRQDA